MRRDPFRRQRRRVLQLALGAMLAPALPLRVWAQPRFDRNPFTLGVASGSPLPDSVVLWTRLAPEPLNGGGMPPAAVELAWEVARDEGFRDIVRRGTVLARSELAHSVRVEAGGLEPARWYWYRFTAGNAASPAGRTRTAPAPGARVDRLRFSIASCQQYEQGWYAAHRHMAAEDLDLVVFLGDYIYESSWGRDHVRKHEAAEPYTLEQYRNRYACYKSDPDLQRSHAAAPWLVTWDDHEVDNDYADDRSEDLDPDFLARRAAAYQAYYEHMPLRPGAAPQGPAMRLYDRCEWGALTTFFVLDDRQYRSHQACPRPGRGGSNVVADCAGRLDSDRTLLGAGQERWLHEGLAASRARWNVIAQQTLMAQLERGTGEQRAFWTDGWDGYPAARARLLDFIAGRRIANPVVVSGDVHCTWIADLKRDFDDPRSPVVASEFCGTSISAQGPAVKRVAEWRARNPHLHYGNGWKRGYLALELDERRCVARLRALDSEKQQDSGIATLGTWAVESGRPGPRKA